MRHAGVKSVKQSLWIVHKITNSHVGTDKLDKGQQEHTPVRPMAPVRPVLPVRPVSPVRPALTEALRCVAKAAIEHARSQSVHLSHKSQNFTGEDGKSVQERQPVRPVAPVTPVCPVRPVPPVRPALTKALRCHTVLQRQP